MTNVDKDRINRILDRLEWTARGISNLNPNKRVEKETIQAWSSDLFETLVLLEDLLEEKIDIDWTWTTSSGTISDDWRDWVDSVIYGISPPLSDTVGVRQETTKQKAHRLIKQREIEKHHKRYMEG